MPSIQLQKRLSTKDKIFVQNQEKQIDGQQVVLLVFFYFSRLIQKKSKPTTNGYSINTDHRMRMSTMWNNYRYISDRTEFYKETLQWGVWTIDRTVKCFRSIVVEVYQCIDFVMDRKLAWTSASRNSTPSLTFFQGHNVTTLHHDTVARIYVSVAIVFIKKKPRSIDGKVKLIVISLMIKTKNYSEILKKLQLATTEHRLSNWRLSLQLFSSHLAMATKIA